MKENYYTEATEAPTSDFDISLRPPELSDFYGQSKVKERISLMIEAAKKREDVLAHILLSGPPGLGKTTLAHIIAGATGSQLHSTSGPQIEKAETLREFLQT